MGWFSRKSAPVSETKSELTECDSTSWAALTGLLSSSASGVTLTTELAAHFSPVNAAFSIIGETARMLPCKINKVVGEGKEPDDTHPAYALVHDMANDWQSAGQVRQQITIDAVLHGDGFGFVGKVAGKPTEILHIPRHSMVVEFDNINRPSYRIGTQNYTTDEIIHLQSPSLDGKRGLGLLQAGRDAIGLGILLERTAARLFKNNSRPGGVLSFKGTLNAPAAGRVAQSWKSAHGGDNAGGVAILDNEGTYAPIAFTSVEAQHQEQRSFAINEIARLTRVPATMLSDLSRATWSNTEQLNLQFLQTCMLPWLRGWTDAYARTLLTKEERSQYSFEFIVDDLLRADTAARATAYSQFRSMGVMTANDVRKRENLPPLAGGDELQNPFTTSGKQPANDNIQPPKESAA